MARQDDEAGPHPVDRHVGRRVCERRITLGLTQSDLARALGLTFQQVQKYEKGSNRISSSKLWDIAHYLQVDIEYFFEGLATASGAGDKGPHRGRGDDFPVTRQSIEIMRLAPQLSIEQQKLALDLLRSLVEPSANH